MPLDEKENIRRKYEDLLENAFDDEVENVEKLLCGPPKLPIDPTSDIFSPDEYSPLSEAAAGNAIRVISLLGKMGADPNHRGRYGRTPLYRSCFNEHEEAIPLLLELGADPRTLLPQEFEEVTDSEGEVEQSLEDNSESDPPKKKKIIRRDWDPDELPVPECVKKIIRKWDITKTIMILEKRETDTNETENVKQQQHIDQRKQLKDEECDSLSEVQHLSNEWKEALRIRESRILEYDNAKCNGRGEQAEATLRDLIKEAEQKVSELKTKKETAEHQLSQIRGHIRKGDIELSGGLKVNQKINLTHLPDVVNDSNSDIKNTNKCAILIDPTENAKSYLKYQGVVLCNADSSDHMVPKKFLSLLLGSVKQGRPFIVDIGDDSTPCRIQQVMSEIDESLYELITTTAFTTGDNPKYEDFISEGGEYAPEDFVPKKLSEWRFLVLTKNSYPEEDLLKSYVSILVE